jgi:glycosyltransferase involved in cell wall biosynthesis
MSGRLIFDITTAALWRSKHVGIVRAELELARRAGTAWNGPLAYSFYDQVTRQFYEFKPNVAREILNGERTADFSRPAPPAPQPVPPGSIGRRRRIALTLARVAQQPTGRSIIRMLRRRLALAAMALIARERELRLAHRLDDASGPLRSGACAADAPDPMPVFFVGPIAFGADDILVSAGLDWEHKDIRQISKLRQQFGFKYVPVCYDIVPMTMPEYCSPEYVEKLRAYFDILLADSDLIMCISDNVMQELLEHSRSRVARTPHAASFHLGCDPHRQTKPRILPESLWQKNFILFVSTVEPRKNHRFAYEVWKHIVRERLVPEDYTLVFVGHVGGISSRELIAEIDRCSDLKERLLVLREVDDDLLAELYKNCKFTIFPSLYEGYGLPLVESLFYKKMCIASTGGSLPEIAPPFLGLLDPHDFQGWVNAIAELINNPSKLSEIETAIRSYDSLLSWNQSAQEFFRPIRMLTDGRADAPRAVIRQAGRSLAD